MEVSTRADLRAWLHLHHTTSRGVWLVTTKKGAGGVVSWTDVVEEALCVGWIDSQPRKLDAERSMRLLTPRRPQSGWSSKNKGHVSALSALGLMQPAGLAAVAAAHASGGWCALDAATALILPDDLVAALAAQGGRRHWDAFPASARQAILQWIGDAKKAATRKARVEEAAQKAALNVRANQWRSKA